ncbi:isoprenoid biosynthesis glyoxalase ElbB [Grimontia sp. NTOU-MAR1]|uniref:isoprenoid biosynthesis glyoxalase ElbB n=1 Tax=Grimontia sp. NTOU-MAR1 TaxID=3111011 RepID=UPI002DBA47AC|nr:isoprenoid biosynthesis glyoxalase ElbB [Grimontia sp. NTOU-MAR1]WRV96605.1 isoprenoid biosynthesis glyoxalase ElbB [Grimontia sp. NTOU-MAR1]
MKKVAVILAGCGVYDGAEIHESVLSLLAIEQAGASWHCFAPDMNQHHVINHAAGEESGETRNVLVEAARIARGDVKPLSELNVNEFDALLLPGGFGVAKNLSTFATSDADMDIEKEVLRVCKAFATAEKPAGYVCISPVLIPKVYGPGAKGTIGNDPQTAAAFNAMGGEHIDCPVDDFVLDQSRRLLSTPAYMLATSVSQANAGIAKLVRKLVELA